jgi:hypothetical protein
MPERYSGYAWRRAGGEVVFHWYRRFIQGLYFGMGEIFLALKNIRRTAGWMMAGLWLSCFIITARSQAQTQAAGKAPGAALISSVDLETLQKMVQALGFECTRGKDGAGNPDNYFVFRAEGYKVVGQVPTPDTISLANVFSDKLTLEDFNEWNRMNRFSRVYLEKDGNAVIESEISLDGGVTQAYIDGTIRLFRESVARWARFVLDHQKK